MTSQTDEALVEAVARAVDATPFECRDHLIRNEAREVFISGHGDKVAEHDRDVKRLKDTARAAIAAVRAHDEARGMVSVPKEARAEADKLRDWLLSIRQYASDTKGGPSQKTDLTEWFASCVLELLRRSEFALAGAHTFDEYLEIVASNVAMLSASREGE